MITRRLRALGAAVLLVALLVGVPLILMRIAGWPLPSKVPDWSHMVTMARQGDIRSEVVTKSVAVVVWIAWLQLVWATVWELLVNLPAQSSGRRAPKPAPLISATVSSGVGRLVATILAIGLIAGSASQAAAARHPSLAVLTRSARPDMVAPAYAETGRTVAPTAAQIVTRRAPNASWVVGETDTLWDIATVALGDGSHVDKILELNPTLASARFLRQGQQVVLPAGAEIPTDRTPDAVAPTIEPLADGPATPANSHHRVVVAPGDNLWDLIDDVVDTPDATDVAGVAAVNDGATTPAGPWVFDAGHPGMIHPGQTFDLEPAIANHAPAIATPAAIGTDAVPDDSAPVPVETPTPGVVATPASSPAPVVPDTAAPVTAAPVTAAPVASAPAPSKSVPAVIPATPAAGVAPLPLPLPLPLPVAGATIAPSPWVDASVGDVAVATIVAAGALALLDARRRRALRSAAVGARLAAPGQRDIDTERALRSLDESERLARIDLAVRACALDLAAAHARLLTVQVSPQGEIRLVTDRPATPSGGAWRLDLADGSWVLPAVVPMASLADDARQAGMACPALVHLGRSGDGQLYVDLEALGTLVVETDAATGADIVRSLAASIALSSFATTAHLVSVGIDADLDVESGVVVHQVDTLDQALDLAERSLGSVRTLGRDTTTFALRARSNGGEEWEPAVVFAALDDAPVDVATLAERAGAGLAIVVAVTPPVAPAQPPDGRRPTGPSAAHASTAGVNTATASPPTTAAAPSAAVTSLWRLNGTGGAFVLEPLGIAVDPCRLTRSALIDVDYLLSSTEESFVPFEAFEPREPVGDAAVARSPLGELLDVFGDSESHPDIDADLGAHDDSADDNDGADEPAAVSNETPPSPEPQPYVAPTCVLLVRLLGPVGVSAADGAAVAFERSKALELVAWLSQHRERPTRRGARTALWDLDVRDSTFANVVSDARRALARTVEPPAGEEWLLRTLTEHLPLHDGVLSDAELLASRSVHASRTTDAAEAIAVLRPGLELVTGAPFAGTGYLWPDAEGITSSLTLLVVNSATELANRYLQLGDADGVFWATGQGLKVLAGHEELIALRMRAHHRAGDLAGVRHEWETYERALDADPWSSAHPSPKLVDLRRELLTAAS